MEEEYDYYEVEVAKRSYSTVYIKVPKGDEVTWKHTKIIANAAVETLDSYDWDDYGWSKDLEIDGVKKVSEKDANSYEVYDATEYFPKKPQPEDPNQMALDFDKK
jgi:hypothetical protein